MEFEKLIEIRRSCRHYAEGVSHEDMVKILKQAQQAPSWKNQQTSRCYVAETNEQELREKGLPAFNQKNSAGAALVVTTFVKNVVGHADGEPVNDGGNFWGAYDLGLHDAYLVLAASNAGYDTLIMGIRDADAIRELLQIPADEQILSVIAIGKKSQEPVPRPRKDLEEVVAFR